MRQRRQLTDESARARAPAPLRPVASAGDAAGVEAVQREALAAFQASADPVSPASADALSHLALVLFQGGAPKAAEPLYRRLAEARRGLQGAEHLQTALAVDNVAACCLLQGAQRAASLLSYSAPSGLRRFAPLSEDSRLGPRREV